MDVVVCLPKGGIVEWSAEGDMPYTDETGTLYYWRLGKIAPKHIEKGDRVYVAYDGSLLGYAPLVDVVRDVEGYVYLVRSGGAVAVTLLERVEGFRGFRYRWWDRSEEREYAIQRMIDDEIQAYK